MSRKRRNAGVPPGGNYVNPLSRTEERNDGGGRRRIDDEGDWKNDMYSSRKKEISVRKGRNQPTDVLVSNLDKDLDEDDVMTVFKEINFDHKVRSTDLSLGCPLTRCL